MADVLKYMPELEGQEMDYVHDLVVGMNNSEAYAFASEYWEERKEPVHFLLLSLLGCFGVAGLQRFYAGQTWLGIAYFLTIGFCLIGTIVDAVNHKHIAFAHNRRKAHKIARKMGLISV